MTINYIRLELLNKLSQINKTLYYSMRRFRKINENQLYSAILWEHIGRAHEVSQSHFVSSLDKLIRQISYQSFCATYSKTRYNQKYLHDLYLYPDIRIDYQFYELVDVLFYTIPIRT